MIDEHQQRLRHEPFLNVPGVITLLVAAIVFVHLGRQVLSQQADDWIVTALGFIPMRYEWPGNQLPGGVLSGFLAPVTHFFVHGDLTHLLINTAMLLAFGGFVARRCGTMKFLAFVAVCSAAGALLFYVASLSREATMIGASGGISGLMAAALRLMFSAVDAAPGRNAGELMRQAAPLIPLKPLRLALSDPRLRLTTVIWFGVNLLAVVGLGAPGDAAIAWEAHIGGYIAGLFLYGVFDGGARFGDGSWAADAAGVSPGPERAETGSDPQA